MKKPLITLEQWDGGLSISDRIASKNQNSIGNNINPFLRKGYLSIGNGWTKTTLSSASDLNFVPRDVEYCQADTNIYIAGDDNKIYSLSGYQTLTARQTSGNANPIQSLREYKGFLYYGQSATVGRKDLSVAVTTGYTDNWQTGLNSTSLKHRPMEVSSDNNLYIGNGYTLAKWDNSTFSASALDLSSGWDIRCLANFGIPYIAIGANFGDVGSSKSKIFLWDRLSSSWNDEIPIPETTIYAMNSQPSGLWILAGSNDLSIYYCPLGSRSTTRVFTFENENPKDKIYRVYPNAFTYRNGRMYFSLSLDASGGSGTMPYIVLPAVYSFNPNPINLQINVEYDYTAIGSGNKIYDSYVVKVVGGSNTNKIIFHSIDRTTTENLIRDNLVNGDSTPQDSGQVETVYFDAPATSKLYLDGFGMDFLTNTGGLCTYELYYKKDNETSYTLIKSDATSGSTGFYVKKIVECNSVKFKIVMSGNGAGTFPFLKRVYATGELIPDPR